MLRWVNATLLAGDYVATGSDSNAEVQFDGISMLRFAPDTQVRFIRLDPNAREMQLASGTVDLAELQGSDGGPQIDTPSVTMRPNQRGDYRVSVLSNGRTLVTVRSGAAAVAGGTGSQILSPGTTLVASGTYSNPSITTQGAIAYDSFDQFNTTRDQSCDRNSWDASHSFAVQSPSCLRTRISASRPPQPRFEVSAPHATHLSFATQQAQIQHIVSSKPAVAPPPRPVSVVHPVYHRVAHPIVQPLTIVKPAPKAAPVKLPEHATTPHPELPVTHATAPITLVSTPRPVSRTAPPVERAIAPRPVVKQDQATAKPDVTHTAAPKADRSTHPSPEPTKRPRR
ncbi:MAG: FecR domain-containing protein [Candidatus Baltobacteraceae bacterium]